jgi:hypothetical protein
MTSYTIPTHNVAGLIVAKRMEQMMKVIEYLEDRGWMKKKKPV